jgi:hypothetical protein
MDKSAAGLSILIQQCEAYNKTEGKSEKTVSRYNELLGLFYEWLKSQGLPTTVFHLGPVGMLDTSCNRCRLQEDEPGRFIKS